MGDLRLRPTSIRQALAFCKEHHRHLPNLQGGMWAVSVKQGEDIVGVAIVGHPARKLMADYATLCVTRVAVREGYPNACSMLLGACSRAMRAMGCDNGVTYTLEHEDGASLKAANWVQGGKTAGGEFSRPSRKRPAAVQPGPKLRWWAPWSKEAQVG